MKFPKIFSNRQFKWMTIAVAIIALFFLILNIFVIGGDFFIFSFNGSINSPLAIIITIAAASVWRVMSREKRNQSLWLGLLLGWGLWALAETIWSAYSVLNQEVPYPSFADLFWMIGYVFLGIGLVTRIRTMPVQPNRFQNMLIWGFSAATVIITVFFVIIPIFQSFNAQRLIEFIPNLFYPLADMFLVIIVWRLFFTFEAGDYGFAWRLLTLGFIFMTVADLVFTYTTWNEIYYPDMQANLVSRLGVDVPYTASYLLFFLGIYALRILLKEEPPIVPVSRVRMIRTYGHILVYTNKDDIVIGTSPNFSRLFEAENVKGKSLVDVSGISKEDTNTILNKLRSEGRVADLPIKVQDRSGTVQEVLLCGLAVSDLQHAYLGSNLLLRLRVADPSFDDPLDQESTGMARYLLVHSGSNYRAEIGQFIADYYLAYIKSLLEMVHHQGGAALSQALLDKFTAASKEYNWQMQFNSQTVLDSISLPLDVLKEALPVLFKMAKDFASELIDPAIVESRVQEISSQFSENIHRDIARYGGSESDLGFSSHRRQTPPDSTYNQ